MKPAIAREFVFVERTKFSFWLFAFVALMCFASGFLVGDFTAEPRFAEREASIMQGVRLARAQADRIAESIRNGCYSYVMSKKETQW